MCRAHHGARIEIRPTRRTVLAVGGAGLAAVVAAACTPSTPSQGQARRPSPTGPPEREMVFPFATPVWFSDTFGAPRSGGRQHAGQDLMAPKMTPLVATADAEVTWLRWTDDGNAGNYLVLTDAQGWKYSYMHLNNDTPGTDDGANRYDQAFADGIRRGQRVRAGELIGWVGDSGNAERTSPHLHFELARPDGTTVSGFNSLAAATIAPRSDGQAAADRPLAHVESVTRIGGQVRVTGWAVDRHAAGSCTVSLYAAGNPVAVGTAGEERPDVAVAHPGRGSRLGFQLAAPAPVGTPLRVVAHPLTGGGATSVSGGAAPG